MQKFLTYSLAILMTATLVLSSCSGGRGYMRVRRTNAGDRSVTIVHRPKYKGVVGSTKPILSSPKTIPNKK